MQKHMGRPDAVPLLEGEQAAPEAASALPEPLLRVLESRTFEKAPGLRKLMLYLWEHRTENIGEYAIAVEALGRKADFDGKTDATVRVQVSRLRRRLKDFYEREGSDLRAQVDIPLGTHQVRIVDASSVPELAADEVAEHDQVKKNRFAAGWAMASTRYAPWMVPALGTWVLLLTALCGWLLWESGASQRQHPQSVRSTALPLFWRGFLDNGKPARIIVPNPVFFSWGTAFKVRDADVNDFARLKESPRLADLEVRLGQPVLSQDYTVASDTFAALRLARYFDAHGTYPKVSSSTESPLETLDHENLIVLGTQGTLAPFQSYLNRLSFRFSAHKRYINDLHPVPGQPARFESLRESGTRTVSPGIIALLPSGNSDTRIFIILGYHTTALVSYLTSAAGADELADAQSRQKNGRFFQAVVVSEVNNTTVLKTSLAAFKKYEVIQ